jgi:hypothetical protein
VTPGQNGVPVFDDFYICDTSGSFNNDFLGDARIKAVFPDGAGNYTEWTPSAGSNYQAVDENPPDDDTTYVSSSTPNQRDTYTFGASGLPSSTVKAVVVNMQARKDDGGTREIAGMARSSSTDGVAATQTLASSYANYQGIFETDPNTSAAWGLSAVDGAEFGHKLIT